MSEEATTQAVEVASGPLDKLSNMSIKGLDEIGNWVSGAKDFVVEQSPLVCQEIITKGMLYHSILIITFLVFTIISIVGIVVSVKWYKKVVDSPSSSSYDDDGSIICGIFSVCATIGFIIGFVVNTYYLLYVWMCPRLYVLEEIATIISKYPS